MSTSMCSSYEVFPDNDKRPDVSKYPKIQKGIRSGTRGPGDSKHALPYAWHPPLLKQIANMTNNYHGTEKCKSITFYEKQA